MNQSIALVFMLFLFGISSAAESELLTIQNVPSAIPIKPTSNQLIDFSPTLAAKYLDIASLNWQKDRNCVTCHTNMAFLMARPALETTTASSGEVRKFFEQYIQQRWESDSKKPKQGDYRTIVVATGLVFNDLQTNGKLSTVSHQSLRLMWETQRDDGGWDWAKCGWAPMEIDDHYGVTLAALTSSLAYTSNAKDEDTQSGIDKIITYLKATPAPSLHHRIMLLWASRRLEGILTKDQQETIMQELSSSQLPDGGWSTAKLLADWSDFKRKDNTPPILNQSDAYATGLSLVVLREFGHSSDSPIVAKALKWLNHHQDSDGKWYTPSPSKDSKQYFTNIGTAFAVMGLQAHGELPGWPLVRAEPKFD
jgi:squalene-hopene/tetraprenyl-beta-curcumene cyclase